MKGRLSIVIVVALFCLVFQPVSATIYGWGSNQYELLGSAALNTQLSPLVMTAFNSSLNITNIVMSAGTAFLSSTVSGNVYSVGNNIYGQLNQYPASSTLAKVPQKTANLTAATQFCASITFTVGVTPGGGLIGFGLSAGYITGNNAGGYYALTQKDSASLQFDGSIASIATAANVTYVLLTNRTVWSSGVSSYGLLGTGSALSTFVGFSEITYFRQNGIYVSSIITGQSNHTCAMQVNGSLYCWGSNIGGQVGVNSTASKILVPTRVNFFDDGGYILYKVRLGSNHTVALTCGGSVFAWGSNIFGQLGLGTFDTSAHTTPAAIPLFMSQSVSSVDMEAASYQTYTRSPTGDWYVWGGGTNGALGRNSTVDVNNPTKNPSFNGFTRLFTASAGVTVYGWNNQPAQNLVGCPVLVDECTDGNNTCSSLADCVDTERYYKCVCRNSWIGDGHNITTGGTGCSDPDVCKSGFNNCSPTATCVSTGGSQYYCECPSGFQGDGMTGTGHTGCTDINECAVGGYCSTLATCTNTIGNYTCQCGASYTGDGHTIQVGGTDCNLICPIGQYTVSRTSCSACPAGTYNDVTGQIACSLCPEGTYNGNLGSTSINACSGCPSGMYAVPGSQFCYPCPAGQYSTNGSEPDNSKCVSCPAGTYGYYGECLACPAGAYSGVGAIECSLCPAGTFSSAGATSCSSCLAGTFSYGGGPSCTVCSPGTYSKGTGNSECIRCPVGTSTGGMSQQDHCTTCAAGMFSQNLGGSICYSCAPGYYSSHPGTATCTPCTPGSTSATGATSCTPCPQNTYVSPTAIASSPPSCWSCPLGTYTVGTGSTTCITCKAGFYRNATMTACAACPAGTYISTAKASGCNLCPAGSYASATNSTYCRMCPANMYSVAGQATCTPCPTGMTSPGAGSWCS